MKKHNTVAKTVAVVALLAIILGVIGTGLLILLSPSEPTTLTEDDLKEMTKDYVIEGDTDTTDAKDEVAEEEVEEKPSEEEPIEEATEDSSNKPMEIQGGTFRLPDSPTKNEE